MSSFLSRLCLPWSFLLLVGCPMSPPGSAAPPAIEQTPKAATASPMVEGARPSPSTQFHDKEAAAMPSASGAGAAHSSAIPATLLRKQILDLIGSLRSLKDLEKPHIEAVLQAKMVKMQEMRDGYYYTAQTTEGWLYRIEVARLATLDEPPTIVIGFNNGVEPWSSQKPTYCTMDFEAFAKDLVALGYERGQRPRKMGGKTTWGFGKDVPTSHAGFGIGVDVYFLEGGNGDRQACIDSFRIGGGRLDE